MSSNLFPKRKEWWITQHLLYPEQYKYFIDNRIEAVPYTIYTWAVELLIRTDKENKIKIVQIKYTVTHTFEADSYAKSQCITSKTFKFKQI